MDVEGVTDDNDGVVACSVVEAVCEYWSKTVDGCNRPKAWRSTHVALVEAYILGSSECVEGKVEGVNVSDYAYGA